MTTQAIVLPEPKSLPLMTYKSQPVATTEMLARYFDATGVALKRIFADAILRRRLMWTPRGRCDR